MRRERDSGSWASFPFVTRPRIVSDVSMVRIGVVLSVLWFIGFGAYMWFSSARQLDRLYSRDVRNCSETFDTTQNSVNYEHCLEEAQELYLSRFDTQKQRIPRLVAVDFGILAFCWAAALVPFAISRFMK